MNSKQLQTWHDKAGGGDNLIVLGCFYAVVQVLFSSFFSLYEANLSFLELVYEVKIL